MKREVIAAMAAALLLAGCADDKPYTPTSDEPVLVDDCPDGQSNGEPCK